MGEYGGDFGLRPRNDGTGGTFYPPTVPICLFFWGKYIMEYKKSLFLWWIL